MNKTVVKFVAGLTAHNIREGGEGGNLDNATISISAYGTPRVSVSLHFQFWEVGACRGEASIFTSRRWALASVKPPFATMLIRKNKFLLQLASSCHEYLLLLIQCRLAMIRSGLLVFILWVEITSENGQRCSRSIDSTCLLRQLQRFFTPVIKNKV